MTSRGQGSKHGSLRALAARCFQQAATSLKAGFLKGTRNVQSIANYSARSAHENTASSSWLRVKVRIRGTAPMRAAWLALE